MTDGYDLTIPPGRDLRHARFELEASQSVAARRVSALLDELERIVTRRHTETDATLTIQPRR